MQSSLESNLICFSFSEIKRATNNFSDQNCLKQGRHGKVYFGNICDNGYNGVVIVKRYDKEKVSSIHMLRKEIDVLSPIHHDNINSIVGYSDEKDEKILVYEFMSNGSLHDYLFKDKNDQTRWLTVENRLAICIGIAKGLNYLHVDNNIIHGCVNSDNIFLDANLVAKISDFPLIRSLVGGSLSIPQQITGANGYLAPECYEHNYQLSKEADVYAFGVVLLEVLCEKPAWKSLIVLALPFTMKRELPLCTPEQVKTNISPKCSSACTNLIMDCLDIDPNKRPSMATVIDKLLLALESAKQQLPRQQIKRQLWWHSERLTLQDIKMATEDFSMNNLLGEGAFSKSYRGNISISSYNGAVFVKRINKEFDHENPPFKHVVELLAGCNHVNVIKAIGYCDEANEKIIVYNFMPNGSLYDYLYNDQRHTCCLSVKQRLNICIGVAEGFAYLHKRDIIHCNLSSDNIFLDHELVPSISGFDLSMTRSTSPYSSPLLKDYKQGNEGYLAPECYEPNYEPDQKADVYAFGMFLLEMLCKKPPWKKLATLALEFSMKGQLPRTGKGCSGACEECSGACVNLIRDCLDIDSGKRPSMLQVVDELKLALRLQEYYRNGKTKCQQSCELNNRNLSPSCRSFLLSDIKKATDNFSNYIGQGAFGKVYSGNISGNRFYNGVVAVKRMSMAPEQGTPAYKKEIELVSACNHVNIINLIGFCEEEDEKILLYELMPNGSLYDYLYNDKHRVSQLTVEQRLEICIGVAKGLDYLHSRADSVIIHSDLKTDNILLDQNLVPKISDFGLSRTRDVGPSISKQTTNHIQGTEGYLAPECYEPGYKVSRKADVYAFGIVLLEVLCERPAWQRLVILALPFIRRGELRNFTPDYVGRHISSRCLRACENLIRDCLDTDAAKRPDMKQVVTKLEEALRLEKKYKNDHFLSLTDPQVFSSSCDHTPCHNYLLEETTLKGYI